MKKIFKNLYIFLFFIPTFSFSQQYNGNYKVEKIYKIEKNSYILLIVGANVKGLIIEDNINLKIDSKSLKIKINGYYNFILDLDTAFYRDRGLNDGFGVILRNGKLKRIWNIKKDGPLPLIFSSANSKGLYINEITIKKD